jgi:BlaI family penicillinase repressor
MLLAIHDSRLHYSRTRHCCVVPDLCVTVRNITRRSSAMKLTRPEGGALEQRVMQLLWARGPLTAEQARALLGGELKEVTVRTVLRRLEEKEYVTHTVNERTFVFSARDGRAQVAARAVKRIVDRLCEGSLDEVLVGMVDAKMLDRVTLDRLSKRIDQAKQSTSSKNRSKSRG